MSTENSKETKTSGLSPTRFVVLIAGFLALVSIVVEATKQPTSVHLIPIEKRVRDQNWVFRDIQKGTWKLSAHRGKVVVINFWATWCGPCIEETPVLVKVANKYKRYGVDFVGPSMDDGGLDRVQSFISSHHVPYPVVWGYDVKSLSLGIPIPTTLLYDREGNLAAKTVGPLETKELTDALESLIAE